MIALNAHEYFLFSKNKVMDEIYRFQTWESDMAVGKGNGEQEMVNSGLKDEIGSQEEEGVLLYYKFVQIPDPERIMSWVSNLCSSLGLFGRIRVAPDGINVTVGGRMIALHEHIKVVGSNPLFEGSDFKLASSTRSADHKAAAECGFTSLSARMVKELVTLGLHPSLKPPSMSKAGKHVSAREFHEILLRFDMVSRPEAHKKSVVSAGTEISNNGGMNSVVPLGIVTGGELSGAGTLSGAQASLTILLQDLSGPAGDGSGVSLKKIVVVDVRNVYETRIGKFCPPQGVEVLDPMVRQYSSLPGWIDANEDRLRNNQILMYCTGGVRCEMASAYIRSKGKEFEDVLQLSGGIQRYLEAFPNGGYFTGKNFVFDPRLAVPSSNQEVVGSCLLCSHPFDDYSARCRCSLCRMLVLVCSDCQAVSKQAPGGQEYLCELCSRDKKKLKQSSQVPYGSQQSERCICSYESKASFSDIKDEVQERKLKILCLHGFRQSASNMKGRLNALRKKLRPHVELVFVNAPHEIPSINLGSQVGSGVSEDAVGGALTSMQSSIADKSRKVSKRYAWLIGPNIGTDHAETTRPECRPENIKCDAPKACHLITPTRASSQHCLERTFESNATSGSETSTFTQQYYTQTEGWSRSWDYLQTVLAEMGPFDGVLGFSQGAAVAAALCHQRGSSINQHAEGGNFRFVILCSGFCSPATEIEELMHLSGCTAAIDFPSLHVFGGSPGLDQQIGTCESQELASLFVSDKRMIIQHNSGHIIPTQSEYVQQYLKFLSQFKNLTFK